MPRILRLVLPGEARAFSRPRRFSLSPWNLRSLLREKEQPHALNSESP